MKGTDIDAHCTLPHHSDFFSPSFCLFLKISGQVRISSRMLFSQKQKTHCIRHHIFKIFNIYEIKIKEIDMDRMKEDTAPLAYAN